jgi:hypothetical protein
VPVNPLKVWVRETVEVCLSSTDCVGTWESSFFLQFMKSLCRQNIIVLELDLENGPPQMMASRY